jgi:antitoxin StbD
MEPILASFTVSVTELKRNYSAILKQAEDNPIAVLNHNRPEVYLLSAAHYERLMSYMEDLEDARLVRERGDGPFVEVALDEL